MNDRALAHEGAGHRVPRSFHIAILALLTCRATPARPRGVASRSLPTSIPSAPAEVPITKYLAAHRQGGKGAGGPQCADAVARACPASPWRSRRTTAATRSPAVRERLEREGLPSGPSGPDPFALPGHGAPAGSVGVSFDPSVPSRRSPGRSGPDHDVLPSTVCAGPAGRGVGCSARSANGPHEGPQLRVFGAGSSGQVHGRMRGALPRMPARSASSWSGIAQSPASRTSPSRSVHD